MTKAITGVLCHKINKLFIFAFTNVPSSQMTKIVKPGDAFYVIHFTQVTKSPHAIDVTRRHWLKNSQEKSPRKVQRFYWGCTLILYLCILFTPKWGNIFKMNIIIAGLQW